MLRLLQFHLLALLAATIFLSGIAAGAVTPVGETSQARTARPGERYQGTITLNNTAPTPVEVKLYQTDYHFDADGRNDYGQPGTQPRSNARWIRLSRDVVVIPPNTTERIDYEVQVPAGTGLSGTYWSMIMVEPLTATSAESAAALPDQAIGIRTSLRYGMQIITEIGNSGDTALAFSNPQLQTTGDGRVFTIDVENTGQRWLVPSLWLELYTDTGNPVGKFQGAASRLFPGTSTRFEIDLGGIPAGKYLGLVAADGTGDNLFGANVELEAE